MYLIILLSLFNLSTYAQREARVHTMLQSGGVRLIKATESLEFSSTVNISNNSKNLIIVSNGIPDHNVGKFPNAGNPHAINKQKYLYRVAINPIMNMVVTPLEMTYDFGVALNGIPFDPGADEWFQGQRNSEWQYEALSGAVRLGVDENHAHVQPTGAYHYHGLPLQLMEKLGVRKGAQSPVIGYAADGFKILALYGKNGTKVYSSYRLKKGTRPIGGKYDGTFVSDYEFVKGSGDLDRCNGKAIGEEYFYFLTEEFPVIPRCFRGTPDPSFRKGRNQPGDDNVVTKRPLHPPHIQKPHVHGPPMAAKNACKDKLVNKPCEFNSPHGVVRGMCFKSPSGEMACRP
ncbi:YHYH protein [Halobacteriovorax sp. HLS]|uniref:YHYH protein n=1 Tax=Halobacteriovorax sp. HLS TaxID=2234000 RepID=UPI000FDB1A2F|nr:YHYH protein [Halobacteriovorax sp. HLS]